jgi:translation initiation factor IF-3
VVAVFTFGAGRRPDHRNDQNGRNGGTWRGGAARPDRAAAGSAAPRTPVTHHTSKNTHQQERRGDTSIEEQRRLNADIKVPKVRLVDADGTQVGIVPLAQALRRSREQDLDLVEVAPNADPPVCRILDWGKAKYEEEQKQKEARKRQSQISVKEIKMRPKISDNDYGTKSGHVRRFLNDGAKVRASIMFRGREMSHTELGLKLLDRLAEDMADLATVEASPKVDGRNMVMVLAPTKPKAPKGESDKAAAGTDAPPSPTSEAATEATADVADAAAADPSETDEPASDPTA